MSKHESGARTYSRHFALTPVEGKGVWIRDQTGRWLLDCVGGAGAAILGWSHPVVNEALQSVLSSGAPLLSLDLPTPLRDRFTDELLMSLPPDLARDAVIHLCAPSGANAIEAALAVAEIATGNSEHIGVEGGFHGCTQGARAVSSGGGLRQHLPSVYRAAHFLPLPQDYRCPFGVGGQQSVELAIRAASHLLLDPHSPVVHPASLIVECVLGEGGSIPAPCAWLRALRQFSEQAGIPMIADEVQAGMGRTGSTWSFEHSGIVPDIVAISKGLGGGVPIAVIVMKSKLNTWQPGAFTGTFRGSALAFAAGAAVLRFAREENLPHRAAVSGHRLVQALQQIQAAEPCIGEVRGLGLMVAAEIVDLQAPPDWRGVRPPAPELARSIQRECFDRGLMVELGGVYDNVVRFLPPLIISGEEIDFVVSQFADGVRAVSKERVLT
jgi:diaminobutyrate-2-oxoglutarate transaminase